MNLKPLTLLFNNQPRSVQEVTGVVAVRAASKAGANPADSTTPTTKIRSSRRANVLVNGAQVELPTVTIANLADLVPGLVKPELGKWQDAGWSFVSREVLPGVPDSPSARVLIDSEGRVSLGTNRLSVKFVNPDADPVQELKAYGVIRCDRLKLAPGLYSVTLDPRSPRDPFDIASELIASGRVVYAEPELIEGVGHR